MGFSIELLVAFFFVAAFAGCLDAIAGGGGLLTIPALLAAGVPPAAAIATNKIGAVAGSLSATVHFLRIRQIELRRVWPMIATAFVGALAGAWLLTILATSSALGKVFPFLLIGFSLHFLFLPNLGDLDRKRLLPLAAYTAAVAPAIGFYDGFFGPGTGTFLAISLVLLLGMNMVRATANAKIVNFTSNLAALLVFIAGGQLLWQLGLVLVAGQVIGGQIGARLVVRSGTTAIKLVMVVVAVALSVKALLA